MDSRVVLVHMYPRMPWYGSPTPVFGRCCYRCAQLPAIWPWRFPIGMSSDRLVHSSFIFCNLEGRGRLSKLGAIATLRNYLSLSL